MVERQLELGQLMANGLDARPGLLLGVVADVAAKPRDGLHESAALLAMPSPVFPIQSACAGGRRAARHEAS